MIPYPDISYILLCCLMLLGLALLMGGGEALCWGAEALALRFNINPVIIGLTVVAVATSMPELATTLYGASRGNYGLAVGNIVGSNLANLGLIVGVSALICPLEIHLRLLRKEMPFLMIITIIFTFLCYHNGLERWEGALLLLLIIGYLYFVVKEIKKEDPIAQEALAIDLEDFRRPMWKTILMILLGAAGLHFGAEVLVQSSVEFASRLGISDVLIGLTIVAIGTSLPELAASIAAVRRGQSDLCAGNVVGSNLFNMMLIGGGVSTIYPLEVDRTMYSLEFPGMIALTLAVWWFFVSQRRVTRLEGAGLLALYLSIIGVSIFFNLK